MFSYFRCDLMGTVTSDLTIIHRKDGKYFAKFDIGIKNAQGVITDHPVIAKSELAPHIVKYVRPGSTVVCHGFFTSHLHNRDTENEFLTQELVLTDLVAFNQHEQNGNALEILDDQE